MIGLLSKLTIESGVKRVFDNVQISPCHHFIPDGKSFLYVLSGVLQDQICAMHPDKLNQEPMAAHTMFVSHSHTLIFLKCLGTVRNLD